MKKFSILLAMLLSLCVFSSCGNDSGSAEAETAAETTTTEMTTATTTEATTTDTTTETTTEIITTEAEIESPWIQRFYIDEFKRETDDPYIVGVFYGTFSNSATTDSKLGVSITVEKYMYVNEIYDGATIRLYEYDSNLVKNPYSKAVYYDIQILEDDDNVISIEEPMLSGYDDIFSSELEGENPIVNALKNNNKLVFRIDKEDSLNTYFFEVDCTGFKELYESTEWKLEEE